MARTKGEEAIVEVDEEIQARKRVNSEEDARPEKRAKEEGNKGAELPIRAGRKLGAKAEGEASVLRDGEKEEEEEEDDDDDEEEEEEEEEMTSEVVNRLRGLLATDPKKLSEKDVGDVIRCLEVDEIVSLALKSGQGDGEVDVRYVEWVSDVDDEWYHSPGDPCAPSSVRVIYSLKEMLLHMEEVTEADVCILHKNFSHLEFSLLLFTALDSYSKRSNISEPLLKAEERDMIPDLCHVLPWKLFAHILSRKTGLPLLAPTIKKERKKKAKEKEVNFTLVQKEGAERCRICYGKGKHRGPNGLSCSFRNYVPIGATVAPGFYVSCTDCDYEMESPYDKCLKCGSERGGCARWLQQSPSYNP